MIAINKFLLLISALIIAASNSNAATPDEVISGLMQAAELNSTTLRANRASLSALEASERTSTNYEDPEIEFEHLWGSKSVGGNKLTAGISQEFRLPGVYSARKAAAEKRVGKARWEYLLNAADVRNQIRNLCCDVITANAELSILSQQDSAFMVMEQILTKQLEARDVTILDVSKIKLERAQLKISICQASNNKEQAMEALAFMTSKSPLLYELTSVKELPTCDFYTIDAYTAAVEESLANGLGEALISVAAAEKAQSRRDNIPGLKLGYVFNREMGETFNGLSASMSIPLFSNRGKSRIADENLSQATIEAQAITTQLLSDIKQTYSQAENFKTVISQYQRAIEESNYQQTLLKAYNGRQISLVSYLQEINYYLESLLTLNNLRADYYKTVGKLELLVQKR
ncbi:MAG: TolC family protein [Muribaculaceae bacterium]|nr:TolC family protein [Muribaculaceae bacterium]